MNIVAPLSSVDTFPVSVFLLGLLLALSALAVEPVAAQQVAAQQAPPQEDTLALSLDTAIERASEQSEEVRLAQAQVSLAAARVASARSAALPSATPNVITYPCGAEVLT